MHTVENLARWGEAQFFVKKPGGHTFWTESQGECTILCFITFIAFLCPSFWKKTRGYTRCRPPLCMLISTLSNYDPTPKKSRWPKEFI